MSAYKASVNHPQGRISWYTNAEKMQRCLKCLKTAIHWWQRWNRVVAVGIAHAREGSKPSLKAAMDLHLGHSLCWIFWWEFFKWTSIDGWYGTKDMPILRQSGERMCASVTSRKCLFRLYHPKQLKLSGLLNKCTVATMVVVAMFSVPQGILGG